MNKTRQSFSQEIGNCAIIVKWFTEPVKSYIEIDVDDIPLRHFITEVLANYGFVLYFVIIFILLKFLPLQLKRPKAEVPREMSFN